MSPCCLLLQLTEWIEKMEDEHHQHYDALLTCATTSCHQRCLLRLQEMRKQVKADTRQLLFLGGIAESD